MIVKSVILLGRCTSCVSLLYYYQTGLHTMQPMAKTIRHECNSILCPIRQYDSQCKPTPYTLAMLKSSAAILFSHAQVSYALVSYVRVPTVVTVTHHAKLIVSSPARWEKTPNCTCLTPILPNIDPGGPPLRDRKNYSGMTTCAVSYCDYGRLCSHVNLGLTVPTPDLYTQALIFVSLELACSRPLQSGLSI